MSPTPRRPPKPKPVKPWRRAEAGRYRSSDERFTLESDGSGRWFVTDEHERDELGLARTTGPFATLDAAKRAADATRDRPAATSPLASRIQEAARRPRPERTPSRGAPGPPTSRDASRVTRAPAARKPATRAPDSDHAASGSAPSRHWLDELAERDAATAKRATRLIAALEREGITGADGLVRRDILGDRPAVATRLLARDVLAAIGSLENPTALTIVEAVGEVLAASKSRAGLPGWHLVEQDVGGERQRPIRLTGADLAAAAENEPPDRG